MIDNHQANFQSQRMVSLALGKNVLSWKSICIGGSDMSIRVRVVVSKHYGERNVVVPASAKDYLRPLQSPMLHSAPTTTNSGYGKLREKSGSVSNMAMPEIVKWSCQSCQM